MSAYKAEKRCSFFIGKLTEALLRKMNSGKNTHKKNKNIGKNGKIIGGMKTAVIKAEGHKVICFVKNLGKIEHKNISVIESALLYAAEKRK